MKSIFAVLTAALALLAGAHGGWAASSYTNTAGGGNWDSAASWTAGSGYPASGDTIALSGTGTITVPNNQQFGATSGSSASTWSLTGTTLALTNGAALTHNANDTFTIGGGSDFYLRGDGTGAEEVFLNSGTVVHKTMWGGRLNIENGATFENRGTQQFTQIISCITLDATSKLFVNDGTITATAAGYIGAKAAGATFTTFDGAALKGVSIVILGGANQELGLGFGQTSTLSGQVKISSLSIGNPAVLSFGYVNMTVSFPTNVAVSGGMLIGKSQYYSGAYPQTMLTMGRDTTWNFGQGVQTGGGTIDTSTHTLTIKGTNTFSTGGGGTTTIASSASGRLVNQGTLYVGPAAGASYYGLTVSNGSGGTAFVNEGTMVLRAMSSGVYNQGALSIAAGTTFSNAPGGVLLAPTPSGGWYRTYIKGGNAATSVFDNQGTVQVTANSLWFADVTIPQISGTSLNGGTWKASSPTPGIYDSFALNLPGSNIQMIGSGAAVYLENGGSINTIGTNLTTINGKFIVNNMSFTTGGSGLTVGATGMIGGSGTIAGAVTVNGGTVAPGNSPGTLTLSSLTLGENSVYQWEMASRWTYDSALVNGSLTLPTTMTFDLRNLGDMAQASDEFVLIRYASGTPSVPTSVNWVTSFSPAPIDTSGAYLTLSNNQLILSGIIATPEPATLALFALGALALPRRRR